MNDRGRTDMIRRLIHLAEPTHERFAEHRNDEVWLEAAWARDSTVVLQISGTRIGAVDGAVTWVSSAQAPDGLRVFLGESEGVARFAVIAPPEAGDQTWLPLRGLLPTLSDAEASYVVHAVGLAEWHWATRFCRRCGGALQPRSSGHVLVCGDCGREQFPRTDPAVIMLVLDENDRALLGRQPSWPAGRWSTLAGFVEPGESLEAAVRREVFEESGIRIGQIDYFGSQPWPLPASLMLGFVARAETVDITVDDDEIEDARWFSRDEALAMAQSGTLLIPSGISISRSLITDWYGDELPGAWR